MKPVHFNLPVISDNAQTGAHSSKLRKLIQCATIASTPEMIEEAIGEMQNAEETTQNNKAVEEEFPLPANQPEPSISPGSPVAASSTVSSESSRYSLFHHQQEEFRTLLAPIYRRPVQKLKKISHVQQPVGTLDVKAMTMHVKALYESGYAPQSPKGISSPRGHVSPTSPRGSPTMNKNKSFGGLSSPRSDTSIVISEEGLQDILRRSDALSALDRRKLASMKYLHNKGHPSLSSQDLVILARLASLEAGYRTNTLNTRLVTRNYGLKWIFNMSKRPKKWMSLDTMPVEHLVNGGAQADHVSLCDSPRSCLTILRNGTDPMSLQRLNFEELSNQLSISGLSKQQITDRYKFLESQRCNELKSLQHEYHALCRVFSFHEAMVFFELLEPGNTAAPVPEIYWDDELQQYKVRVSSDDFLNATMNNVHKKLEIEQAHVKKLLDIEIDVRKTLVAKHAEQLERNLEAATNHQKALEKKQSEVKQEAALRKMAIDMKRKHREMAKEEQEERRLKDIFAREENAKKVEMQVRETNRQNAERRHQRTVTKQETRQQRMEHSAAVAARILREREESLAAKEHARDVVGHRMAQKQIERKHQHEEELEVNAIRRQDIVNRAEASLWERTKKAEDSQHRVEQRLEEFADEKRTKVELHRLIDLKKEIRREEAFIEARRLEREKVESQLKHRQEQEERHQQFRLRQGKQTQFDREEELQLNELKGRHVRRAESQHHFDQLLLSDKLLTKCEHVEKVAEGRKTLADKAREERHHLHLFRTEKLKSTGHQMECKERQAFFEVFKRTVTSAVSEKKMRQQKKERNEARMNEFLKTMDHAPRPSSQLRFENAYMSTEGKRAETPQ